MLKEARGLGGGMICTVILLGDINSLESVISK
jgi:hypothetical protein